MFFLFRSGQSWNNVCGDQWNDDLSELACNQLGFVGVLETTFAEPLTLNDDNYVEINGDATRIQQTQRAVDTCNNTVVLKCSNNGM